MNGLLVPVPQLTKAPDYQRDEVPGSRLAHLEDVQGYCDAKQNAENYGTR